MTNIQTDQKINQNIISMVIGASFIGLSDYFKLSNIIKTTGVVVMILSALSVCINLIPYTIHYWKEKLTKQKRI